MRLPEDPAYRRLKVAHRTPWGSASYWLAEDHLLIVHVIGFIETYRRIDRADLQLILVQPSPWGRVATFVSAGVSAVSLAALAGFLVAIQANADFLPFAVLAGVAAAVCLVALGWSLTRWRSCRTVLQTAVQALVLPGVDTLPLARRLIAELRPSTAPPAGIPAP